MHISHPEILIRLKRVQGHLASTVDMLEKGRSCEDIAQQLQAVESAIRSAKKILIQEHIEDCISAEMDEKSQQKIKHALAIAKYL